ncbi:hypothetical protein K9K85_02580 [Patescibacteria group bacterium]|nr:hypothetical protein [Patescibacteria group bacterium]
MIKEFSHSRPLVNFWKDSRHRFLFLGSLALNLFLFFYIFFVFSKEEGLILLRYDLFSGVSVFGPWVRFLALALLGLLIFLVNSFLSSRFYENKEFRLSFVLLGASFLVQLILILHLLLIVFYQL